MKRHQGLLWLEVEASALPQLRADAVLGRLLLTEPTPGLFAVRTESREALLARLKRLGLTPKLHSC